MHFPLQKTELDVNTKRSRRKRGRRSPLITSFLLTLLLFPAYILLAQPAGDDYLSYYNKGDYKQSLDMIKTRLTQIYEKKSGNIKLPSDLVSLKTLEAGKNLIQVFRNRKVAGFFIESDKELFTLHLYAARCYFKQGEHDSALNNYKQALRYHILDPLKDDSIAFEVAQVYKAQNRLRPYRDMLESAYSMNPAKSEYSHELGLSLYRTNDKKRAIYHLERYLESKGEADDPSLYLMLGNLNEDIDRFLETQKYYQKYLVKKPDDPYVNFALGYIAYKKTGDFKLAHECFDRALKHLPEKDVLRRSKANEFKGDMFLKDREFSQAETVYLKTIEYQKQILGDISKRREDILKIRGEIDSIKLTIKKTHEFNSDYYTKMEEQGKLEQNTRDRQYELNKLNEGKVRWNLAESYERKEKLADAVRYYKECVARDYNTREARKRIEKLQLKINRGY